MKTLLSVAALGVIGLAATYLQRAPEGALSVAAILAAVALVLLLFVPSLVRPRRSMEDILGI